MELVSLLEIIQEITQHVYSFEHDCNNVGMQLTGPNEYTEMLVS